MYEEQIRNASTLQDITECVRITALGEGSRWIAEVQGRLDELYIIDAVTEAQHGKLTAQLGYNKRHQPVEI